METMVRDHYKFHCKHSTLTHTHEHVSFLNSLRQIQTALAATGKKKESDQLNRMVQGLHFRKIIKPPKHTLKILSSAELDN